MRMITIAFLIVLASGRAVAVTPAPAPLMMLVKSVYKMITFSPKCDADGFRVEAEACTATGIMDVGGKGPNYSHSWVITAAHCLPFLYDKVPTYTGAEMVIDATSPNELKANLSMIYFVSPDETRKGCGFPGWDPEKAILPPRSENWLEVSELHVGPTSNIVKWTDGRDVPDALVLLKVRRRSPFKMNGVMREVNPWLPNVIPLAPRGIKQDASTYKGPFTFAGFSPNDLLVNMLRAAPPAGLGLDASTAGRFSNPNCVLQHGAEETAKTVPGRPNVFQSGSLTSLNQPNAVANPGDSGGPAIHTFNGGTSFHYVRGVLSGGRVIPGVVDARGAITTFTYTLQHMDVCTPSNRAFLRRNGKLGTWDCTLPP